MFNWQDFIDSLFCSHYRNQLATCNEQRDGLVAENEQLQLRIDELEKILPRPAPPELANTVEKDTVWVQEVLMDMKVQVIRLPLGTEFRLVDKDTFIDFIAWDWVDSFEYHKFYRCGNFSISFKASADQWGVNQVGIVLDYKSSHAYNLVIFPNRKVMLLEPQADNLFFHEEHAPQFYPLEGAVVII